MEMVPVENQSHHSVLSDYQLEVDGVIYRELKTLNHVVIEDGPHAGMDEQVLGHTRSIGDLTYSVSKISELSDPCNEAVSDHDWYEADSFQEKWDKNWNWNGFLVIGSLVIGFLVIGFLVIGFLVYWIFKKMLGYE